MALARKTWIVIGAAIVAGTALLAWAFAPRPVEVEVAVVATGRFERTLDEDARTRLIDRHLVSAPLAGRLERPTLREGDTVAPGDTVARLTPALAPMLDARSLAERRAAREAARTNVHRAATRVQAARIAQQRAAQDLQRTELLAAQGFVAPIRLEGDRLALDAARQDLAAAVDGLRIAEAEQVQAEAALAAIDGRPGRPFEVRAPIAGRVLKVHQTSESIVPLGAPLIEIGDTRLLEVVAELLTSDALLATPGRPVRLERWGGPTTLQGRVRQVEPAAFTKVSALGVEEQRVRVLIDLTSPPADWASLGDGYRVGVRIVVQEADGVLLVPVSATFPQPSGAEGEPGGDAVFVVRDGRARRVPVTVTARNGSIAWIGAGLSAGATVVVYPPAALDDGVRVRLRSD
jgi:HlyD family secretion protein